MKKHRDGAEGRLDRDRAGERRADDRGDSAAPRPRRLSGSAAVQRAAAHLVELTARQPEAVSALERTRDGWRVTLEIVELERIPQTTDILASYAVEIDNDGELMGYHRTARYYRSDVSD